MKRQAALIALYPIGAHSIVYLAFELLARSASYVLALGLTYLMSPEDYGHWALLLSIMALLGPFFGGAFATAAGRWYFDRGELDFRQLVFTLGICQLAFILIAGVCIDFIGVIFLEGAIEGIPYTGEGRIIVLAAALSSLPAIPMAVLVSQRKSHQAGWIGIAIALFPALGMGLGGIIDGTLNSILWGLLFGQVLVGLVGLTLLSRMSNPQFNGTELFVSLAYGIPMVPHILGYWFLNSVDRLMLQQYRGPESVAAYHVAYLAGFAVLLVAQAMVKSWTPLFLDDSIRLESAEVARDQDQLRNIIASRAASVTAAIVLLGGLTLIWGDEALALVIPAAYETALRDTAIIVLGNVFFSLYMIPVAVLFFHRATLPVAGMTVFAALVNVILNALWIPLWGTTGAALATLISHLLILVLVYRVSTRFQKPLVSNKRWLLYGTLLVAVLPALVIDRTNLDLPYRIAANLVVSSGMLWLLIRSGELAPLLNAVGGMLRSTAPPSTGE